jgi:small subunit ribosomal protein S9
MPSNSKIKIIARAVGRRKTAIASVHLTTGSGQVTVNGHPAADYFPGPATVVRYKLPFTATGLTRYNVSARVIGGGKSAQLDALVLGISRALSTLKPESKSALKSFGLLTRDSRTRQRRMVGTGGKARRKKQSPKR